MPEITITISRTYKIDATCYPDNATPRDILTMAVAEIKDDPQFFEEFTPCIACDIVGTLTDQDGTQESIALGSA